MRPRFSVVIPVRDRADVIGRAVAGVLAQTFADVEVLVVDDGSTDDTVAAARAVADARVRILRQEPAGEAAACANGLGEARGRWTTVLCPDTEVNASWLARFGRLVDATGARFVTCGGEQRHVDGTLTEVVPRQRSTDPVARACLRPGAFATETELLVAAATRIGPEHVHPEATPATVFGAEALRALLAEVGTSAPPGVDAANPLVATPDRLVRWNDPALDDPPEGDELRLAWAFQALDALARSPIPDGALLARYATVGGVAAARLRRRADARLLFRIACSARPEVTRAWARYAVSLLPPLSDRVWDPDADDAAAPAGSASDDAAGAGRPDHDTAIDLAATDEVTADATATDEPVSDDPAVTA